MSYTATAPPTTVRPTLAADLEQMRLRHRIRRLERVVAALGDRARERSVVGPVPDSLVSSIAAFSAELDDVRERVARFDQTA